MSNQTPPTQEVSEDQLSKWLQVMRDRPRKVGLDKPTFQYMLEHPELAKRLDKLLDDMATEYRQSIPLLERPAWKTIQLGAHSSADVLREALVSAGINVSNWAGDILQKVKVATKPQEVNLIIVTVAELGFPDGATRKDIYEKALELGFELCPAEVGPELRLQYADQPMYEWLRIAMEPITVSVGSLGVFRVVRDSDGLWLFRGLGHPGSFWYGDNRWVFCRKLS